jgi:hypothetical protein
MILYRHAPSRAARLDGVTEIVLAQLRVDPADPDWAAQLLAAVQAAASSCPMHLQGRVVPGESRHAASAEWPMQQSKTRVIFGLSLRTSVAHSPEYQRVI